MHRHERSLVQKYRDKPFAVLGVKVDGDLAALRRAEKQKLLTWRSIWDGKQTNVRAYDVRFTPTLILVDHRGRKVREYEGGQDEKKLRQDIDKLLSEAEKGDAGAAAN
jgi:thioredoxin-like negative regulator of GroEL